MLYLIGLGLSFKDLSIKALEAIKKSDLVYLETYTSTADFTLEELSKLIGKEIIPLNREQTEQNQNKLRLTRGTYQKIMAYAELTSRISHTGMECYGYLIRPKWSTDDLITDA